MQSQPIDFHPPAEEAAAFILPDKSSVFADRARRFETLAEGHSLNEWLDFLAQLSCAQDDALKALPELALPDPARIEQANTHHMPLLDTASHPAIWQEVLRQIGQRLGNEDAPSATQALLHQLSAASSEQLNQLANDLLNGEPDVEQAALLPFIAAALQVVYTGQASQLRPEQLQALDTHGVCPCCGSLPVASIVRLGAAINNLRYLHCSLCNTEWNVTRATCTACNTDKSVALQEIEGTKGAVRAETCDACKSYLKIVYQEKDPMVDPVADDLATLALDMLVDEAGYQRSGPNLLLIGAYSG
jgi:FdhE protein